MIVKMWDFFVDCWFFTIVSIKLTSDYKISNCRLRLLLFIVINSY